MYELYSVCPLTVIYEMWGAWYMYICNYITTHLRLSLSGPPHHKCQLPALQTTRCSALEDDTEPQTYWDHWRMEITLYR